MHGFCEKEVIMRKRRTNVNPQIRVQKWKDTISTSMKRLNTRNAQFPSVSCSTPFNSQFIFFLFISKKCQNPNFRNFSNIYSSFKQRIQDFLTIVQLVLSLVFLGIFG